MSLRRPAVPLLLCMLAGCMTRSATRGFPLYSNPGEPLARNKVATLATTLPVGVAPGDGATSFIKTVDGRDVLTLDSYFEVLPGCHVVTTDSQLMFGSTRGGWRRRPVPPRSFIFDMKAGSAYFVVVRLAEQMNGFAVIVVDGTERDPTGKETRIFNAVPGFAARQACVSPVAPAPLVQPPSK
jgi:hypothetical protein